MPICCLLLIAGAQYAAQVADRGVVDAHALPAPAAISRISATATAAAIAASEAAAAAAGCQRCVGIGIRIRIWASSHCQRCVLHTDDIDSENDDNGVSIPVTSSNSPSGNSHRT